MIRTVKIKFKHKSGACIKKIFNQFFKNIYNRQVLIQSILQHECQTRATRMQYERHEWDNATRAQSECWTNKTSAARVLHERHECDTSEKILILITTRLKTYFHSPYICYMQLKDYKERNNFILITTFWKYLVPMPKCVWKVHHKNWTL